LTLRWVYVLFLMEIETPVRRRADVCREQSDTPDAKALLVLMSASFAFCAFRKEEGW
jgi:hypothetical protein